MRKNSLIIFLLALAFVGAGCAGMSEHKGATGAGVGALGGAGVGAAIGSAFGVPGLGAAIGAGGGALIGKTVGDEMQRKDDKKEVEELKRKVEELEATKKTASPEAAAPGTASGTTGKKLVEGHWEYNKNKRWVDTTKIEKVYVPEHTEGDKRIDGHYEERSVPGGYWEEYEEKVWVPDHYE